MGTTTKIGKMETTLRAALFFNDSHKSIFRFCFISVPEKKGGRGRKKKWGYRTEQHVPENKKKKPAEMQRAGRELFGFGKFN